MKFASCFCLGLLAFGVFAQGGDTSWEDSGPEIYSDISKKAQAVRRCSAIACACLFI
jgi:hypothetical protein